NLPAIKRIVRPGTGLIVVTAPHGALSTTARAAIARFRLKQYVVAGLYDPVRAGHYDDQGDPALQALADHDLHIAVGDDSGRFLAYLCVQSALPDPYYAAAAGDGVSTSRQFRPRHDVAARLWQRYRPLFPVETEYGAIYSKHPGMCALPMHAVRELSRLLRNQEPTLRRDPLAGLAIAETLLAGIRAVSDRTMGIEAIVGCANPQNRRSLAALGIPVAYAPDAPVVGDNLGGASAAHELLWTPAAHDVGLFWPCAIASVDLRLDRAYYAELNAVLAAPLAATDVLRQLLRRRMGAPRRRARYIAENTARGSFRWTDAPYYDAKNVSRRSTDGIDIGPRRVITQPLGSERFDTADSLPALERLGVPVAPGATGASHSEDAERAS
ncbi:MAG TPA: hypothetical protein VGP82_19230, partial [Ktedonobacterales bacterium]|nr:hypothetical protein [Ktedonobacterales bacterium]